MKKLLVLGIALLLMPIAFADCTADYATLERFYDASMHEHYDDYITLMDTAYIYDYVADEESYKNYVTSAWDVYDTKEYELSLQKCDELENGSILFFHAKSVLVAEKETFPLEREYVAVLEHGKIQFVMDLETFSFHQSQAYMLQYYNQTQALVNEELATVEEMSDYAQSFDHRASKSPSALWWASIMMILLLVLVYYRRKDVASLMKKHEHKVRNVKEQAKRGVASTKRFYNTQGKKALKELHQGSKRAAKKAVSESRRLHEKAKKKLQERRGKD